MPAARSPRGWPLKGPRLHARRIHSHYCLSMQPRQAVDRRLRRRCRRLSLGEFLFSLSWRRPRCLRYFHDDAAMLGGRFPAILRCRRRHLPPYHDDSLSARRAVGAARCHQPYADGGAVSPCRKALRATRRECLAAGRYILAYITSILDAAIFAVCGVVAAMPIGRPICADIDFGTIQLAEMASGRHRHAGH